MNTNCYNTDCPWRSNETSNPTHCDCFACQNRTVQDFTVIATDHAEPLDVAPVRHGRWKNGGNGLYDTCSACEKEIYLAIPMNYCPECGALMDGKEADHETSQHL